MSASQMEIAKQFMIKALMKGQVGDYFAFKPSSVSQWKFSIIGPKNTPYQNLQLKGVINFPSGFPSDMPNFYFSPPILHPNVSSSNGSVCFGTLQWQGLQMMKEIVLLLYKLLIQPNPKDPYNGEIARLYLKSYSQYHDRVRSHAKGFCHTAQKY